MSKLTQLKLENVTAFSSLDLSFSPGINVFIGANGSGKTHLLKILYTACSITVGEDKEKPFGLKLRNAFSPYEGRIGRLSSRLKKSVTTKVLVTRQGGQKLSAEFSNHTSKFEDVKTTGEATWKKERLESAYIPVKEMLAHAPGFLATAAKREIAFEEVYIDIIKRAFLPKLMGPIDKNRTRLLNALQKAIEGRVITKGEHFFLKSKQGDLEFTLLAEGMRKLALIWLLIQNGILLNGSILFWDEPEANLNPSLMGEVVEVILELQRMGVQVFLTTHNYVLLKEFDLRKKKTDQIQYVSLFRDESEGVTAKPTNSYLSIVPNVIAVTFADLYQRDMARALKGAKE
ncbi:MAG TPA: AAA family ATPase [Desulfuromonadales bacterium]|nr:AAA family ATPase [Desulfuromonadales bacterium]